MINIIYEIKNPFITNFNNADCISSILEITEAMRRYLGYKNQVIFCSRDSELAISRNHERKRKDCGGFCSECGSYKHVPKHEEIPSINWVFGQRVVVFKNEFTNKFQHLFDGQIFIIGESDSGSTHSIVVNHNEKFTDSEKIKRDNMFHASLRCSNNTNMSDWIPVHYDYCDSVELEDNPFEDYFTKREGILRIYEAADSFTEKSLLSRLKSMFYFK